MDDAHTEKYVICIYSCVFSLEFVAEIFIYNYCSNGKMNRPRRKRKAV
jgi:hypothetical protein